MALNLGLYTGLKGLNAARLQMQLAGHNVANANTPGFTRQSALLASSFPITTLGGFQLGSGVEVNTIRRIMDSRLEARIRTQNGLFGYALIENRRMVEIEGLLSEPGDGGIAHLMNEFFSSVSKLRSDAGSRSLRGGMLQAAESMTGAFNILSKGYSTLRDDTLTEVAGHLKELNTHVRQVATLNQQILTLEAGGHPANDLRDQRQQAIKSLSELMDTQAIDRGNGVVDVLAGGYLVVSGGNYNELRAVRGSNDKTEIRIGNTTTTITPKQGKIASLLSSETDFIPRIQGQLDSLARTLALEVNRIHSTGVSKKGPFTSLISDNPIKDGDADGQFDDELLSFGDFPFDISQGELHLAVTDLSNGNVERTKIEIQPDSMTLGDFRDALNAIDHITAVVDPSGKLRITAESGYGFDFSNKLDEDPNTAGTLGGTSATLGGSKSGPFNFSTAVDFRVQVDGASPPGTLISLDPSDFKIPSSVSAQELSRVLQGKFDSAGLSVEAHHIGDNISLKTGSSGTTSSLLLTDGTGSPLSALGIPAGVTATGRSLATEVAVSGSYTGKGNGYFRFVPESDGMIGVTQGLKIAVYNQDGAKVATLDVGNGYSPGDTLDVVDGVKVSFGPGQVSATNGDQIALDTLEDSDTSDVLVALGLNSFFTGSTASDIGVSDRLKDDPELIAAALRNSDGDSGNLIRFEALRSTEFSSLTENTIESFYSQFSSDIGFETRKSQDLLESRHNLLRFLENERESISGVNMDEEMVNLVRFQQAFQASARFISVISQVTETLMTLGR